MYRVRPGAGGGPVNGEEALSQALAASADRWYAVPGYPVTGIAEACGAEITVNEKVALEYALGDSLSGQSSRTRLQ